MVDLAQRGPATRAGEHGVGGNFVPAGRTVEPVPAKTALLLRETLLLFAFRAAAIHLTVVQILFKKQPTAWTFGCSGLVDGGFAAGNRALKNGFTVAAPVVALESFTAARTFLDHFQLRQYEGRQLSVATVLSIVDRSLIAKSKSRDLSLGT